MRYKSKWQNLGINQKERNKTYSKLRSKAKTILKIRYRKEYLKILKRLLERKYQELNLKVKK